MHRILKRVSRQQQYRKLHKSSKKRQELKNFQKPQRYIMLAQKTTCLCLEESFLGDRMKRHKYTRMLIQRISPEKNVRPFLKNLSVLGNFKLYLLCALALLIYPVEAIQNQDEYRYLDKIAVEAGADKNSQYHNYTEIYSQYFAPYKEKSIKFLEIGIYQGASVKMWEEYFPNADLHFMDITFQELQYYSKRSHYHLCNQENRKQLQEFVQTTGGNFDIIIDDGGHTMNQQITSFSVLFPHVKSGGMYIIEDLHTSYWASYGGGKADSTVNFLKTLIDDVNYVGARTSRASHENISPSVLQELTIYREKIYSIHFYDSVAIVIKR
jgi:hypothetical protein